MKPLSSLNNALRSMVDFIFPSTCHLCGAKLSGNESYLCPGCISRLPRTLYHRNDMNPMEQRFAGLFPFEHATGYFFYASRSDLSILMQDLKYRHYRGLAARMGSIVARELITTPFLTDIDYIIPVPMHILKKARRGYNQTEEIAKGINEITHIPVKLNLKAIRPHKTQTKLTLEQRRSNTNDLFRLIKPEEIANKHILLLDDVCTTGSTLTSAAEAILKESPTTRLSLLTIGVTF